MSLNKTLDRLFDEIRREAKRNSEFADRLDAVLRAHGSRREVSEEAVDAARASAAEPLDEARRPAQPKRAPGEARRPQIASLQRSEPEPAAPALNPAGLLKREGEAALSEALTGFDLGTLRALVAEHNLDPAGETPALTRDELAAHIVGQARRRAERDEKMFEY